MARDLPGRPGSVPEAFIFSIDFRLRLKIGLEGPLESPRQAPDVPQGNSRAPLWFDFGSIFRVDFHKQSFGDALII